MGFSRDSFCPTNHVKMLNTPIPVYTWVAVQDWSKSEHQINGRFPDGNQFYSLSLHLHVYIIQYIITWIILWLPNMQRNSIGKPSEHKTSANPLNCIYSIIIIYIIKYMCICVHTTLQRVAVQQLWGEEFTMHGTNLATGPMPNSLR